MRWPLGDRVPNSFSIVNAPTQPFYRDHAVIEPIHESVEGAYRINIGPSFAPEYVFCTGRGVLQSDGINQVLYCRMNSCGDGTLKFFLFDAIHLDDYCYHTCFKE